MPASGAQLSPDDIRRIARLSRLAVGDGDIEAYRGELGAVLGYVERLGELDLSGVEPLSQVGDEANRLDEDEPGAVLGTDVAMALAPDPRPPFYSVPKVLGEGGGA